jgi:hypothetical protein
MQDRLELVKHIPFAVPRTICSFFSEKRGTSDRQPELWFLCSGATSLTCWKFFDQIQIFKMFVDVARVVANVCSCWPTGFIMLQASATFGATNPLFPFTTET